MKKIINLTKEFSPSIIALALPALAFAQQQPALPVGGSGVPTTSVNNVNGVLGLLCTIFGWAFVFLIVLAVIFIIAAAFKYLTAAGDPEKVKAAGTMLIYTAVAIGVALLAKAVPPVIGSFLGSSNSLNVC